MDREDVIKMAKAAKVPRYAFDSEDGKFALVRFAALVAAAERERCAKVAEKSEWISAAIRALT